MVSNMRDVVTIVADVVDGLVVVVAAEHVVVVALSWS